MNEWPFVSILIVTYNKREILETTLKSVLDTDYPNFEIIIVDNASTDGTSKFIKRLAKLNPRIKLVVNSRNLGHSEGCNIGVRCSNGNYIAKIDDDVIVDRNWLKELVNVMLSSSKIGAVQSAIVSLKNGRVQTPPHAPIFDYLGIGVQQDVNQLSLKDNEEIFAFHTISFLVRRKVLDEVGGFDSVFFTYIDEIDISWRIRLRGYSIVICPKSRVYHLREMFTAKRMPYASIFYLRRNHILMLIKNYEFINIVRFLPLFLTYIVLEALYQLIFKNDLGHFTANINAILWPLKNLGYVYSQRLIVQHFVRKVPDSHVMKLLVKPRIPSHLLKSG